MSEAEDDFEIFVASRGAAVRRTAYLLTGNWHLGEDLVQVALTKIYLRLGRLDPYQTAGIARTTGQGDVGERTVLSVVLCPGCGISVSEWAARCPARGSGLQQAVPIVVGRASGRWPRRAVLVGSVAVVVAVLAMWIAVGVVHGGHPAAGHLVVPVMSTHPVAVTAPTASSTTTPPAGSIPVTLPIPLDASLGLSQFTPKSVSSYVFPQVNYYPNTPIDLPPDTTPKQYPRGMALGFGQLWAAEYGEQPGNALVAFDPTTGRPGAVFPLSDEPQALAVNSTNVLVLVGRNPAILERFDPTTRRVTTVASTGLSDGAAPVAFHLVANDRSAFATVGARTPNGTPTVGMVRIDLRSGAIRPSPRFPCDSFDPSLALTASAVWLGCTDASLIRLNPDTLSATGRKRLGDTSFGIAGVADKLWMTTARSGVNGWASIKALRVDPSTLAVSASVPLPDGVLGRVGIGPDGLAWAAGVDSSDGNIILIRLGSPPTAAPITLGVVASPDAPLIGDGVVWVLNSGPYVLFRVVP